MAGPTIIEWIGEIDAATTAVERARVDDAIDSQEADALCIDLRGVTFFDSSGLGLLVHVRNACHDADLTLTLRNVTPHVRQLLAITGMLRLFDIEYAHPTSEVDPATLPKRTPLPAEAVPTLDRIARLTARLLDVPTAIVSLVDQNGQVFPGAVGMREPDQSERRAQLSHSLCKHVVARAAELIIPDLSADALFAETPAALEVKIRSYAGTPITGSVGQVVGSLCAIRNEPTQWDESQLSDLRDLAEIASAELRARESVQRSRAASERLEALHTTVATELVAANRVLAQALEAGDDDVTRLVTEAVQHTDAALAAVGDLRARPGGRAG